LERNVPLALCGISDLAVSDATPSIESYFQKEGFVTLLKRFEKGNAPFVNSKKKKEKPPSRQESMF
jgi:hypothetical protein